LNRLAILSSHPIQYHAPLFRALVEKVDLHVFYAHRATPTEQACAGFGTAFDWDVDLTSGYDHTFLYNWARKPGTDHFKGCDTPEIGQRLRAGRFHALLLMGWHLKTYIQGLLAAKWLGLPVLVRSDSQLDTPRRSLKRKAKTLAYPPFLRLFDSALYVGQRSRVYYTYYGYPQDRLFFSPHCVDTEWFAARATPDARANLRARLGIDEKAFVLLFAGKLLPFKRPTDVLAGAAIGRAAGRPIHVMVAGDGMLREEMRAEAASLGVPLHLLGFCNQSEMPSAYAAADVLVLPSDGRETWGLVANEALACGRPVIISDSCGCGDDLAADGRAGKIFRTGDIQTLADAITTLITAPPDPEEIAKISDRHGLGRAAAGIVTALEHSVNLCRSTVQVHE
jgi:glycosyltransferase involved in cell wall biosynthesis